MNKLPSANDERTVAIVLPYAPAPSETFITNHIRYLPANVVTIEGWRPSIAGRTVLSFPQRVYHKLLRTFTKEQLEVETTAAYIKAFRRASRVIYPEDQYLWSFRAADELCAALRRDPDLLVVIVILKLLF
jgi:hypothetical protein